MYRSGKTSDCNCRKPPAESQRWTTGSRFSIAISSARTIFLADERIPGAALHGGIVGADDHLAPGDDADADDGARRRRFAAIGHVGGERGQFEERRAGVEQLFDPLARPHLALAAPAVRDRAAAVYGARPPACRGRLATSRGYAPRCAELGARVADHRLDAAHRFSSRRAMLQAARRSRPCRKSRRRRAGRRRSRRRAARAAPSAASCSRSSPASRRA